MQSPLASDKWVYLILNLQKKFPQQPEKNKPKKPTYELLRKV